MKIQIPANKKIELANKGMFLITEVTYETIERLCSDILEYTSEKNDVEATLLINSSGGDPGGTICFKDFRNTLRKDIKINGIAFSECGSAAFALLQCCDKRQALRNCGFLFIT